VIVTVTSTPSWHARPEKSRNASFSPMRFQAALHSTPEARERTVEGGPNRWRACARVPCAIRSPPTARSPWTTYDGEAAEAGKASKTVAAMATRRARTGDRLVLAFSKGVE
jgi:hypothetical protein